MNIRNIRLNETPVLQIALIMWFERSSNMNSTLIRAQLLLQNSTYPQPRFRRLYSRNKAVDFDVQLSRCA